MSTNFEDTPSATRDLFGSRPKTGKMASWDEESDVDTSVVSENCPWLPEYLDQNTDPLSPEDDDSEELLTLEDIRTQYGSPTSNAALNLAAKTYWNKDERNPFSYSPTTRKNN